MSSKFKRFLGFTFVAGAIFLVASQSLAVNSVDVGINAVENSNLAIGGAVDPMTTVTRIINIAMGFLSLLAVCLILWGGFIWMTSNGSEDRIETAKNILRNGVIGLGIILSAWGIAYFVLTKLLDITGGGSGTGSDGCLAGAKKSCGCDNSGQATCNESGSWGNCIGATCNSVIPNKTSCDGDKTNATCEADNDLCGTENICDTATCICEPKKSLGESCNSGTGSTCAADDNLCGPYLKCDKDSCVCVGPPVITGVSPTGGFCENDQNRGCNLDTDCLSGSKCNISTPNGAANNFITIYGYNFGTSSNAFESFLTNIDFEKGAVGFVPSDWDSAYQKRSSVGIVNNVFKSGKQSVRIHQDPNLLYPGVCDKKTCEDIDGCVFKTADNTCNFSSTDYAHATVPAVYQQGETLVWGNSYRVMWTKLTYNLAPLSFKVGDTYSIQFYYKGRAAADINVQVAPNLGWTAMCVGYDYYAALKSGYTWDGTKVNPTPPAGEDPCGMGQTCPDQPNACCMNTPYQKKCYGSLNLTSIPAGDANDWTLYSYTFQYTPEMDTWLTNTGAKMIELGMSIGYNPTGAGGTDFYVDDFTVTKILNTGQITFLGANAGQSQLANFPKLLNPNCISYWTDRQITVAVPSGAATGPIQVKREGVSDDTDNVDVTNDDLGPQIPNFLKNNIYRPGLCQISPEQGLLGATVGYQGVNLKNGTAYFGEYSSAFKGINSNFSIDNLSGKTLAPSITPGKTTTFVEQTLAGVNQKSNALKFIKEPEKEGGPYISSFYPEAGQPGQYVTILGSGFGNMRGSRKVLFGDKEASYDFPEVCLNSVWSDSQIIVKVPEKLEVGAYGLKLDLGNNEIINTDLLAPNDTFKVSLDEKLKPSLCKIDPIRGQIGDKVSLWGEYFGDNKNTALVIFNRNISTSSNVVTENKADKIETTVQLGAITGSVFVRKEGLDGNKLNFVIGKCASNNECGASSPICCPDNTYKSGSCAATILSCYFEVPNSVYETKFNTTLTNQTTDTFDSCTAMATFFKGCQTGQFCPNSPGKCSPFNPVVKDVVGDCGKGTEQCGALDYCKSNSTACTYDSVKDLCQAKKCQLEKDLEYSLVGSATKYKGSLSCRAYNDKITNTSFFVKQLKVTTSCPNNWVSVGDGYCVNLSPETCEPCATNFKCAEDSNKTDDFGICESAKLCASGATCGVDPNNSGKLACLKEAEKKCDCCCEIGQDTRDCCAGLTCAGTCGTGSANGVSYGSCSGCDKPGASVLEKDAACNCSSTSGKFCDTSKTGGICVDCAALDATGCAAHSGQCCFDTKTNVCQGGDGTVLPGGKCAYYDCNADTKTTCNATPKTTGRFKTKTTCESTCPSDPKTVCDLATDASSCASYTQCCYDGKNKKCTNNPDNSEILTLPADSAHYCAYYNCDAANKTCNSVASTTGDILGEAKCGAVCKSTPPSPGASCASSIPNTCNTSFCGGTFSCLTATGAPFGTPAAGSDCGICCCDPKNDLSCASTEGLKCMPDKGNCSGAGRGECCGCKADSQCGAENVATQGCGIVDSVGCCSARPNMESTKPANNSQNICRNSQLELKFNQVMDVQNLPNNVLLLEEKAYGVGTCPNGTTLSLNDFKPKTANVFVRLYQKIANNFKYIFKSSDYQAIAAEPSSDKLYCVIATKVDSKLSYTANNATSTTSFVKPNNLLAANTNYFVVVKGDEKLDSNSGVLNENKIGFNGIASSPIKDAVFNGVTFKNSYTFGFRTMDDKSGKNGLCTISKVIVEPDSFLISNLDNDISDDNPAMQTFDSKSDSDRMLGASAYSSDNQLLQPVSGYNWNWKWSILDSSVAKNLNTPGLPSNEIVVAAVSGITDRNTKITATVDMSNFKTTNASFDGDNLKGVSDLQVFLCANPWPMERLGKWSPWLDNCKDNYNNDIAQCKEYNYKFYYCRDAGVAGTNDDLPAVTDPALILGSSDLICSTDGASCSTQNAACGVSGSGTCIWNVLKESYFFREAIPQSGTITQLQSTGVSGQVSLSWMTPISNITTLKSFKIYYGLASGQTSSNVLEVSVTDAACVKNMDYRCSIKINNLNDGDSYYVKVSAVSDKNNESPLFGGNNVTPEDKVAPKAPIGLKSLLSTDKLMISWAANTDDAIYYRLFHGLFSGKISDSVDSGNLATSSVFNLSNYRAGNHYFYLSAVDKSGNISSKSAELLVTVPEVNNVSN
jgi:hypothetical protein